MANPLNIEINVTGNAKEVLRDIDGATQRVAESQRDLNRASAEGERGGRRPAGAGWGTDDERREHGQRVAEGRRRNQELREQGVSPEDIAEMGVERNRQRNRENQRRRREERRQARERSERFEQARQAEANRTVIEGSPLFGEYQAPLFEAQGKTAYEEERARARAAARAQQEREREEREREAYQRRAEEERRQKNEWRAEDPIIRSAGDDPAQWAEGRFGWPPPPDAPPGQREGLGGYLSGETMARRRAEERNAAYELRRARTDDMARRLREFVSSERMGEDSVLNQLDREFKRRTEIDPETGMRVHKGDPTSEEQTETVKIEESRRAYGDLLQDIGGKAFRGQISQGFLEKTDAQLVALANTLGRPEFREHAEFIKGIADEYRTLQEETRNAGRDSMFLRDASEEVRQGFQVAASAAQGMMLGMSALEGNITNLAFSLIFLQFAGLGKVAIAAAAVTTALGLATKTIDDYLTKRAEMDRQRVTLGAGSSFRGEQTVAEAERLVGTGILERGGSMGQQLGMQQAAAQFIAQSPGGVLAPWLADEGSREIMQAILFQAAREITGGNAITPEDIPEIAKRANELASGFGSETLLTKSRLPTDRAYIEGPEGVYEYPQQIIARQPEHEERVARDYAPTTTETAKRLIGRDLMVWDRNRPSIKQFYEGVSRLAQDNESWAGVKEWMDQNYWSDPMYGQTQPNFAQQMELMAQYLRHGVMLDTPFEGAMGGIPGFAMGARNVRGGMAIVGERGPEMVRLPRGSDVYSNSESRAMGGSTIYLMIDVHDNNIGDEADADMVAGKIQREIMQSLTRQGRLGLAGM